MLSQTRQSNENNAFERRLEDREADFLRKKMKETGRAQSEREIARLVSLS